jgi:O-antigen/teichoic acid export membrane protein
LTSDGQGDLVAAAKGGGVVFAGRLFAWGSRFALAVLLARLLGSDQYGFYNAALSVAAIAASFSIIGLDAALVRYAAVFSARGDESRLWGSLQLAIGLPALLGCAVGVGLFLAADGIALGLFREADLAPLLRIVAIMVPAMVLNQQLAATLQGLRQIQYGVLAEQFTQPVVRFVLLLAIALLGMTAERAVLASMLSALVVTVLLVVFLRRFLRLRRRWSEGQREVAALMRFSLPVYFSNIVNSLGQHLQVPLLGALSSMAAAGVFAVASQINLVGSIFHQAVVSSSMPIFAQLHDGGDHRGVARLYQATSKWTLTLNLPFFLAAILFPQALLAIFGPEFQAGADALVILGWANLVNAATGTSGAVLDMTGHTGVKLLNSTISVVLALGLSLLLIPTMDVRGAAIASLVAVGSVNLLRLAEVRLLLHVQPFTFEYAKPLVAGLAGALAAGVALLLTASESPVVQGAVGLPVLAVVYVILLARFGLSDDDRMILQRARGRFRRRRRGKQPVTSARVADDTGGTA